MVMRCVCTVLLGVLAAGPALAQAPAPAAQGQSTAGGQAAPASDDFRPRLPSRFGDTGLWFVPTADVLRQGGFSTSLFHAKFHTRQGLIGASEVGVTAAVGLTDRFELFGSYRVVGLDRNVRPLFTQQAELGGVSVAYPFANRYWSGMLSGPLAIGGKVNLLSQSRGAGLSLASRVLVELPTGPDEITSGTVDTRVDLIASGEMGRKVELSGVVGLILRPDADPFELSHGLTWGVGTTFPSRAPVRALVEVRGEAVFDDVRVGSAGFRAIDASLAPAGTPTSNPVDIKVGLVFQPTGSWFLHGGASYSVDTSAKNVVPTNPGQAVDTPFDLTGWGIDVRLGWYPGRRPAPPPPPAPAPPPPPPPARPPAPPPANRAPTFSLAATCDPMTVIVSETSRCTATAIDPDGDPVTYLWTAPTGSFNPANTQNTVWTAPAQPRNVVVTVAASDGRDGMATSTVTLQVIQRTVLMFDDVHFDFDRSEIRPDGIVILSDAVTTLMANPDIRLTIEGHTDGIGTAEYNLALGQRRATVVHDYLLSRGIAAGRLETVTYGEERPIDDNATVAGRAMNRRAHIVIIMSQ